MKILFVIVFIIAAIVAFITLRLGGTNRSSMDTSSPQTPEQPNDDHWPFDQPRQSAVITMRQILEGAEPILLVSHDADDRGWQFIGRTDANAEDARVVGLEQMVARDPSIRQLADLPPGWQARRRSPKDPWKRSQ